MGPYLDTLYLWAVFQDLPVGPFIRRRDISSFKAEKSERNMIAFYWLDFLARTYNIKIDHYLNSGKETRILGFTVDGFNSVNHTIYQFQGCWYHGHYCQKNSDDMTEKRDSTQRITQLFRNAGYTVIEKFECNFRSDIRNNQNIRAFINSKQPEFFQKTKFNPQSINYIILAVTHGTLFGFIECDIHVPERWELGTFQHNMIPREYFSEMCPIFGNTENPFKLIAKFRQRNTNGKPKENFKVQNPKKYSLGL